jgi:hypothetical protein
MSSFTTPLEVEFMDGKSWKVQHPFTYHLGDKTSPDFIEVPVGFITDFASVPRILWVLLPPTGSYGKAAVIHDWLYQGGKIISEYPVTAKDGGAIYVRQTHYLVAGRRDADAILLEAMGVLGVRWWTRYIVYLGVRFGGKLPWINGHAKPKQLVML